MATTTRSCRSAARLSAQRSWSRTRPSRSTRAHRTASRTRTRTSSTPICWRSSRPEVACAGRLAASKTCCGLRRRHRPGGSKRDRYARTSCARSSMESGGGPISLDHVLVRRWPGIRGRASLRVLLGGGTPADRSGSRLYLAALVTPTVVSVITLGTYQVFHNGLWGELYNASKTPHVVLSNPSVDPAGAVSLTMYRNDGPDTYGAFIVRVDVSADGQLVEAFSAAQLAVLPEAAVRNETPQSAARADRFA